MAWLSPAIREKVIEMLEEHFPYPQSDFAKEHYGKGVVEGRRKGEAELLVRQLNHRFGEVPSEVEDRVRGADEASIQRWGLRLLTFSSLEAVFLEE